MWSWVVRKTPTIMWRTVRLRGTSCSCAKSGHSENFVKLDSSESAHDVRNFSDCSVSRSFTKPDNWKSSFFGFLQLFRNVWFRGAFERSGFAELHMCCSLSSCMKPSGSESSTKTGWFGKRCEVGWFGTCWWHKGPFERSGFAEFFLDGYCEAESN